MKIIDIYNKIANDETMPIKILFNGEIYEWKQEIKDYMDKYGYQLTQETESEDLNCLCEEISLKEEQEDKKIEKLSILTFSDLIDMPKEELVDVIKEQRFKINEIIDKINKE